MAICPYNVREPYFDTASPCRQKIPMVLLCKHIGAGE